MTNTQAVRSADASARTRRDRSYDDLWLTLHAHLHIVTASATSEIEQVAVPHLVLSHIELANNGRRQPMTGETVASGYLDAVTVAEESTLGFTDRVRLIVHDLRRLERIATTLTETLCAGRSRIHAQEALEVFTSTERPPW